MFVIAMHIYLCIPTHACTYNILSPFRHCSMYMCAVTTKLDLISSYAGDHPWRKIILNLSSLWLPVTLYLGVNQVNFILWKVFYLHIKEWCSHTGFLRFNRFSFTVVFLKHWHPESNNCSVYSSLDIPEV